MSFHAIYPSSTVGKFSTGGAGRNLGIKKMRIFRKAGMGGVVLSFASLVYPPFDGRERKLTVGAAS